MSPLQVPSCQPFQSYTLHQWPLQCCFHWNHFEACLNNSKASFKLKVVLRTCSISLPLKTLALKRCVETQLNQLQLSYCGHGYKEQLLRRRIPRPDCLISCKTHHTMPALNLITNVKVSYCDAPLSYLSLSNPIT